jgi:hypothetical protein
LWLRPLRWRQDPAKAGLTTFYFTGQCSDCSGTANAVLVVQDYDEGGLFSVGNFVSFYYDGTNLHAPFTLTPSDVVSFSGAIGPGFPGKYTVNISASSPTLSFFSGLNGYWGVGAPADYGRQSIWSLTAPEPASLALLLVGLTGLAMARRRWWVYQNFRQMIRIRYGIRGVRPDSAG